MVKRVSKTMSIGNINCIEPINCIAKEDVGSANVYRLPLNFIKVARGINHVGRNVSLC
jgi:hypothetical protein